MLSPFQLRLRRGIERYAWSLAQEMALRDVEVDLLTWNWPRPVSWGALHPRVRVRRMPYTRYFMARAAVVHYVYWLLRRRYDWVMLFFAGYGEAEAMRVLRALRPQRYCVVFHFPYEQAPHRYREFERDELAQRANQRIAVSHSVARDVETQFGGPCAVIGNGVDPRVFQPSTEMRTAMRQKLGLKPDAPMLITAAALEERKGVQCVIRALPLLVNEFPDLCYVVLGEGSYRAQLRAEIEQRGLACHVRLMGNTNDVVSYLAAADVGCLLSYGEAFPISLIELMAMELPVLTSRHAPFAELMKLDWGRMVDEQDTKAVAGELRSLLLNTDSRHSMGKAGRQHVLQCHTWRQVADSYLQLLSTDTA
jgi:phosphatidylinositol alpha-1,6-mannosyltransferase